MRVCKVAAVIAGLSVLAIAAPASAQSLGRKMDLLRLQEQAGTVAVQVLQSDGAVCAAQLPVMKTILADPRFDRLDADARRPFLYTVMLCAEVKDLPMALAAAERLEPLASDPSEIVAIYSVRMSDDLQRDDRKDAATRFLALTELQPAAVAGWEPEMLSPFAGDDLDDQALSLKLLQRITTLEWTSPASRRAAANEWSLAYGRRLADAGRADEAGKAVEKADDIYVRLMIAGDRRFAAVWDRYQREGRFDWKALAEAELARARTAMDETPEQLRPVQDALVALRALARYDEAIEIGEAYRARLQDGEAFEDAGVQAPLLLVTLGHALFETGRTAEAEALFKETLAREERAPSVDAALAWAHRQLDLGRDRAALATLDAVDRDYMTPYGRFWLDSLRVCAQAGIDPKAAEATLSKVREGETDNPGAVSQALLCLNRIDEAAALLARRLAEPDHRAGGLDPYWITLPPPHVTPRRAAFERRRQAMLAHPVSLKALEAVGRKVEAPLAGDYWGGF